MTGANGAFALEQYNIAIRDLLVPLSQNGERGIDLCLISCILFSCFEVITAYFVHGYHSYLGSYMLILLEYARVPCLGNVAYPEWREAAV